MWLDNDKPFNNELKQVLSNIVIYEKSTESI